MITADAVSLIHEAEELLPKVPKPQRHELEERIRALVSIVVLNIRAARPEVTLQQWYVYAGLREYLSKIKEAA